MNNHITFRHGITEEYPNGPPEGQGIGHAGESRVLATFATLKPPFEFNYDTFKQFLTRGVVVTNTPFLAIKDPTFRSLLTYLLPCVNLLFQYLTSFIKQNLTYRILYPANLYYWPSLSPPLFKELNSKLDTCFI